MNPYQPAYPTAYDPYAAAYQPAVGPFYGQSYQPTTTTTTTTVLPAPGYADASSSSGYYGAPATTTTTTTGYYAGPAPGYYDGGYGYAPSQATGSYPGAPISSTGSSFTGAPPPLTSSASSGALSYTTCTPQMSGAALAYTAGPAAPTGALAYATGPAPSGALDALASSQQQQQQQQQQPLGMSNSAPSTVRYTRASLSQMSLSAADLTMMPSGGSPSPHWSQSTPALPSIVAAPPPAQPAAPSGGESGFTASSYLFGGEDLYYAASSAGAASTSTPESFYGAAYQNYVPSHDASQFAASATIAMASAIQSETYALLSHGLVVESSAATARRFDIDQYSDDDLRRFLQTQATFRQVAVQADGSGVAARDVTVYLNPGGVHLHVDRDCVSLADVEAVRLGCKTVALKGAAGLVDAALAFSVHSGARSWSLAAYTREQFDLWVNGIIRLVAGLRELSSDFAYVKGMWSKLEQQQPAPTARDVQQLLHSLALYAPSQLVDEYAAQPGGAVDFASFVRLLRRCRERPVVKELFRQYGDAATGLMSATQLLAFARTEQREADWSVETAEGVLAQFGGDGGLTCAGFEAYLTTAKANGWENPTCRLVYQDMTRPLHEYYIASSHNTYLEGNQLTSRSTTAMYERVLKTGCRCVELDLHDGPDGPVITHGKTLTSKLRLQDVLAVIKKFAFYASEYPLVLSLENHTSPAQQALVAGLIVEYLGDMLAPSTLNLPPGSALPSPEQLKHRVLIKGPLPVDYGTPLPPAGAGAAARVIDEFARLMHLGPVPLPQAAGAGAAGGEASPGALPPYRMTSLNENKLKTCRPQDVVRHGQRYLVRTYPAGKRVDSSNPDPVDSWQLGCQMCALNYQDAALPLLLNFAKFSDNGGCGYILKPHALRFDESFEPTRIAKPLHQHLALYVRVLSARQLPPLKEAQQGASSVKTSAKKVLSALGRKLSKPPAPDQPFFANMAVQLEVHGVPSDRQKQRTATAPNGEYGPSWDTTFTFQFNAPELAILTISVLHVSTFDYKVCHAGIPVLSLRQGYRIIPMRDSSLKYLPMTDLLCHFSFR